MIVLLFSGEAERERERERERDRERENKPIEEISTCILSIVER